MKWITRERVKVDRVACPWLIRKFVDKDAEFVFAPADKVMAEAKRLDATPYDVKDVELGHHGKECSFDAIIKKYNLANDPALILLAISIISAVGWPIAKMLPSLSLNHALRSPPRSAIPSTVFSPGRS